VPAFPVIAPYDAGLLEVGDGQRIYWEQVGEIAWLYQGVGRFFPEEWERDLAKAWPGARLVVVEDSGHTGSASMTDAVQEAFAQLAATIAPRTET
jgi:hypothetical protein